MLVSRDGIFEIVRSLYVFTAFIIYKKLQKMYLYCNYFSAKVILTETFPETIILKSRGYKKWQRVKRKREVVVY